MSDYFKDSKNPILKAFRGKDFEKQWDECVAEDEAELAAIEADRKARGIADVVVPEEPADS